MAAEAAANPNANAERRSILFIPSSLYGKRLHVFGRRSGTDRRIRRVWPLAEYVALTAKLRGLAPYHGSSMCTTALDSRVTPIELSIVVVHIEGSVAALSRAGQVRLLLDNL